MFQLDLYINLRRSRDGSRLFVWVEVCMCVCVSDPRFIQFALSSCYAVHINSIELKYTSKGATCKLN